MPIPPNREGENLAELPQRHCDHRGISPCPSATQPVAPLGEADYESLRTLWWADVGKPLGRFTWLRQHDL
jgi:hypothetical protein